MINSGASFGGYTVAKLKTTRRASVYSTGESCVQAVPDIKQFGVHKTNFLAKKAVVLTYMPELADSSDEHIRRVSKEFFVGSMKMYKVVRI